MEVLEGSQVSDLGIPRVWILEIGGSRVSGSQDLSISGSQHLRISASQHLRISPSQDMGPSHGIGVDTSYVEQHVVMQYRGPYVEGSVRSVRSLQRSRAPHN
jgi:hypothetical protein